jgi:hypothetical protein
VSQKIVDADRSIGRACRNSSTIKVCLSVVLREKMGDEQGSTTSVDNKAKGRWRMVKGSLPGGHPSKRKTAEAASELLNLPAEVAELHLFLLPRELTIMSL